LLQNDSFFTFIVYNTDHPHLCTSRWAWGTASCESVRGSRDLCEWRMAGLWPECVGRVHWKGTFSI